LFQVTEQCQSYVWKVRDSNDKVNFTLYYETLCPDCRQFMTTELYKAYQSVLYIVNITLVPYGNAHETYQPATQLYQFVCQHGADECLGNLIHVKYKNSKKKKI
jgi:interferon gamma-inducible protein 30